MLVLASIVALNSTVATPQPAPGAQIEEVTWKVRGISHTLRVRSDGEDEQLKLIDRPHEYLRSVVGPMVSTLVRHEWVADNGGYLTLEVKTEFQGDYHFDLIGFLDQSGQTGTVLTQMLTTNSCLLDGDCTLKPPAWSERPHCPSPKALSSWDGGFVETATMLVDAGCVPSEAVRLEPLSYWIESWNGRTITMAVQQDHCDATRSACGGSYTRLEITPPSDWLDWLEDAQSGKGWLPVDTTNAPPLSDLPPTGDNALGIPAPTWSDGGGA